MSSEFATKVLKDMAEIAGAASDPEKQAAFEAEMEQARQRQKKLDDMTMEAMRAMSTAIEMAEKAMVENSLTIHQIIDLSEQIGKLGGAMASLRMSLGYNGYINGLCRGYAV